MISDIKMYIIGCAAFAGGMSFQFGYAGLFIAFGIIAMIGGVSEFVIKEVRKP